MIWISFLERWRKIRSSSFSLFFVFLILFLSPVVRFRDEGRVKFFLKVGLIIMRYIKGFFFFFYLLFKVNEAFSISQKEILFFFFFYGLESFHYGAKYKSRIVCTILNEI